VHRQVSAEFAYEMKSSALMRRTMFLVLTLLVPAVTVHAGDWGMGQANARLPHPSMLRPVSTPAQDISTLAVFVLMVTTAIFVIVSALLTYSVIRFRARPGDGSEPPQLYGSAPVEFAWTAVPVLIVFVLILTTARSVYTVQAAGRPPRSSIAIGYEKSTQISLKAYREDLTLRDAALKLGFVTAEQFDEWVRPEDMTHPLR
jgi:heme/copper-type cytochrome/quinol oxidase subunit 2